MQDYVVLHSPGKDGTTLYDHCCAIQETTGKWPQEYPLPEVPPDAFIVWNWYWQIRQGAASGFNGPEPISYSEIDAWGRLLAISIEPSQVRLLRILDQQYMTSWHADQKKRSAKQKK